MESCKAIYEISKLDILDSRKYTRSNPDLSPPTIGIYPHKIGQKYKKSTKKFSLAEEQSSEDFIPRVNSLPGRLNTLQGIEFDVNLKQSLFRSKSLSWIDQIVVDSSIYFDNPIEDLFQQGKSRSHLIHTLD